MLVGLGRRIGADAINLVTHDHGTGHRVVCLPEIDSPVGELRRIELVALPFQTLDRFVHAPVGVGCYPVVAATGGFAKCPEAFFWPDHVHVRQAKRIAGADDGGQIPGLVDLVG